MFIIEVFIIELMEKFFTFHISALEKKLYDRPPDIKISPIAMSSISIIM